MICECSAVIDAREQYWVEDSGCNTKTALHAPLVLMKMRTATRSWARHFVIYGFYCWHQTSVRDFYSKVGYFLTIVDWQWHHIAGHISCTLTPSVSYGVLAMYAKPFLDSIQTLQNKYVDYTYRLSAMCYTHVDRSRCYSFPWTTI